MTTYSDNIILPFYDCRHSVLLTEIVSMEASRNYTEFRFKDGRMLVTATTLKRYEERIGQSPFFYRLNRSFIVNLQCISVYDETVTLHDGRTMQPSRRRVNMLRQKMKCIKLLC